MSSPPSSDKVRVRIDPTIHEQAQTAAQARGISVGDYLELLVRQDGDVQARRAGKLAAAKSDRAAAQIEAFYGKLESLTGQVRYTIDTMSKSLPKALDAGFAGMKDHISNTGGTGHLRDMISKAQDRTDSSLSGLKDGMKRFEQNLLDKVASQGSSTRQAIATEAAQRKADRWSRKKSMGLGGLVAALLFFAFAFVFSNSPPARWLAMRLVGENVPQRAAGALLGREPEIGLVLLQTQVLYARDKGFQRGYADCLDRFDKASEPMTCTLRLVPWRKHAAPAKP